MAAKTIKKLLKSLQNDLESAWKSVQRLRTLLESPKQRKNLKNTTVFHHFRALEKNKTRQAAAMGSQEAARTTKKLLKSLHKQLP